MRVSLRLKEIVTVFVLLLLKLLQGMPNGRR